MKQQSNVKRLAPNPLTRLHSPPSKAAQLRKMSHLKLKTPEATFFEEGNLANTHPHDATFFSWNLGWIRRRQIPRQTPMHTAFRALGSEVSLYMMRVLLPWSKGHVAKQSSWKRENLNEKGRRKGTCRRGVQNAVCKLLIMIGSNIIALEVNPDKRGNQPGTCRYTQCESLKWQYSRWKHQAMLKRGGYQNLSAHLLSTHVSIDISLRNKKK